MRTDKGKGEGEQMQKWNKIRRAESRLQHSGLGSCYTFEDHTVGRGGKRGYSAFYDACSLTKLRAGYLYAGYNRYNRCSTCEVSKKR